MNAPRVRVALAGLATALLVAATGVLVGAPVAVAGESPAPAESEPSGPPIGPATEGQAICTVNDPDLDEITGMVASGDVIYAVEGGTSEQPFAVEIWTINATTCAATSETYGFSPIDPQDLALGTDGALWVADIGFGVFTSRERATMERVDLQSGADAVPYRARYPASGAFSATAVLLDQNNVPIIIGNSGQTAVLWRPDGPMTPGATDGLPTLQQVGQFSPVNTDTATPRGPIGRLVVTGAAMSPDRTKVVLRTESDAYEFTVTGGDIVAAITQGTPTITPLPNEENGQAITYSADGSRFLTLSARPNPVLRAYTPYVPQPPSNGDAASGDGGGGGGLSFRDITTIAMITGFLGLVAVVVGVVGIVRARRQYFQAHPDARDRSRGPRGRGRDPRDRRGPGRRDYDDDYGDDYGDGDEYGATRPAWPPRPREDEGPEWPGQPRPGRVAAPVGADDDYGGAPGPRPHAGSAYGGSTYGSGGAGSGGGRVYGSGGTPYGSGGATYGSGSSGTTYGSSSSGTTYGSSGTTYGSGSTTYGSGGSTYGSSGRSGGGSGGGVYGRPRSDRDDDDPRRPYGRDNIDV